MAIDEHTRPSQPFDAYASCGVLNAGERNVILEVTRALTHCFARKLD